MMIEVGTPLYRALRANDVQIDVACDGVPLRRVVLADEELGRVVFLPEIDGRVQVDRANGCLLTAEMRGRVEITLRHEVARC